MAKNTTLSSTGDLVRYLIVLAMAICCRTANAGCAMGSLHFDQADRLINDIDSSRQNLMALTNVVNPLEKMEIRIAHDDFELTVVYYSTLNLLSGLRSQMNSASDRATVDSTFVKVVDYPAKSAHSTADFLTVMASQTSNEALMREVIAMRDQIRQLEVILSCQI